MFPQTTYKKQPVEMAKFGTCTHSLVVLAHVGYSPKMESNEMQGALQAISTIRSGCFQANKPAFCLLYDAGTEEFCVRLKKVTV